MSELFKALEEFKPKARKKIFQVIIDGKELQVDLEKHKEILLHGAENFMLKGKDIVRRPIKTGKIVYGRLVQGKLGYDLHDNDPYWPNDMKEGGYTWTR